MMKTKVWRLVLGLALVLLGGKISEAGTQPLDPGDAGLVLDYSFEEGDGDQVADSSGNKNEGKISGNPKWVKEVRGKGLDFQDASIELPYSESLLPTEELTVALWFRAKEINTEGKQTLVVWGHNGDINLSISGGNLRGEIATNIGWFNVFGETELRGEKWYHAAVTYSSSPGTAKLYLNGKLAGEKKDERVAPITIHTLESTAAWGDPFWMRIGTHRKGGSINSFHGIMDKLKVFKKALSETEIRRMVESVRIEEEEGTEAVTPELWERKEAPPLSTEMGPQERAVRDVSKYGSIQEAINDLPPGGGMVYVPAGTYIISQPIFLVDNLTLTGSGRSTVLKAQKESGWSADCMVSAIGKDGVTIRDLTFDGNHGHTQSYGASIGFGRSRDSKVEGCHFINSRVGGIRIHSHTRHLQIIGNHFRDADNYHIWSSNARKAGDIIIMGNSFTGNAADAICLDVGPDIDEERGLGVVNVVIKGNIIDGTESKRQTEFGIALANARDVIIEGNTIKGFMENIHIEGNGGRLTTIMSNNIISDAWQVGINIASFPDKILEYFHINNNHFFNNEWGALNIHNCRNVGISGNTVTSNKGSGISVSNSEDVLIDNNVVNDNVGNGIEVSNSRHLTVMGNRCFDSREKTEKTQIYGLHFTKSDAKILGNDFSGNREEPLLQESHGQEY